MRSNLRQQTFRAILCRLAKKNGPKPQPAANRFFEDAQAFNGTVALFRALGARKCPAELLDQCVVAAFDAAQPLPGARQRLRRIEGRHNALVKQLRWAFSRAERTEEGDCAIEGLRILEEAIRSGLRFRAVFFRESTQDRAERLLPQIGAHVEALLLPDKLFDSVVPSGTPQGVAAPVRLKEWSLDDSLERVQIGPVVVLAGLQDPGNLGTILRS